MHPVLSDRNHLAQRSHGADMQDGVLRRLLRSAVQNWRRRNMIATFESMDDYLLRDIGINRSDIARFVDGLDEHEIRMAPPVPLSADIIEDQRPVRLAA